MQIAAITGVSRQAKQETLRTALNDPEVKKLLNELKIKPEQIRIKVDRVTPEQNPDITISLYISGFGTTYVKMPKSVPEFAKDLKTILTGLKRLKAAVNSNEVRKFFENELGINLNDLQPIDISFGVRDPENRHFSVGFLQIPLYISIPEKQTIPQMIETLKNEILPRKEKFIRHNAKRVFNETFNKTWKRKDATPAEIKQFEDLCVKKGINPQKIEFYTDIYGLSVKTRAKLHYYDIKQKKHLSVDINWSYGRLSAKEVINTVRDIK